MPWTYSSIVSGSKCNGAAADTTSACAPLRDFYKLNVLSILHRMIVDHLLVGQNPGSEPKFKLVHLMNEVTEAMAEKYCQVAILVAPAQISHVQDISEQLERMPPKSTFFYPKLLSVLVFNPLT